MLLTHEQIENRQGSRKQDVLRTDRQSVEPETAKRKPRRTRRLGLGVFGFLFALATVWGALNHRAGAFNKRPSSTTPAALPLVPVVAGTVAQQDVPVYLDGLGTVQAFYTVTARVRVDGQLQKVAFVEGQDIHAGDLLAQIDPAPYKTQVEQNEAKKGQDEAQLVNARVQLKRDTDLLAAKILAQTDYDTQKALADQYEAAVKADQAAIDNAKVQLGYTTIVSPIDGRIGVRQVDPGNIVHATDPNGLVVITQLRPISVVFTLPEQTLGELHEYMTGGDLTVRAMDRDNRSVLDEGKLAVIDNQIDTTTGTIKLKATFPNKDLRLWPGQFVNARLLITTRKDAIVVPAAVVQRGPEGPYAFVISDDSTVEIRPLKLAQIEDGLASVEDGLRPGERVVLDGQYKLQAGSRVKLAESANTGKARRAADGDANSAGPREPVTPDKAGGFITQ